MKVLEKYRIIDQHDDVYVNEKMTRVNRLFGLKDLLDYYKINNTHTICEIGSYAGSSSELLANYGKTLYCIDIWEQFIFPPERAIMVKKHFDEVKIEYSNIIEVNAFSEQASDIFNDKTIDMVYIDADHTYEAVMQDIKCWLPKVKNGGIISGHDYCMEGVKQAVDEVFGEKNIKYFDDSSWAFKVEEKVNKISFIIPTYNRQNTLIEAIKSVETQALENYEVIVVSDGHNIITEYVTKGFNNKNIKYYSVDRNSPDWHLCFTARDYGVKKATGNWIVFLDDDNIIYEDFIKETINHLDDSLGMLIYKIKWFGNSHDNNRLIPSSNNIVETDIDTLNAIFNINVCNIEWLSSGHLSIYPDYYYFQRAEKYCNDNNYEIKYIDNVLAEHRNI